MLELRNIKKKFNPGTASETIALDNVNLTLKEGDFITVIGGNGAGKSTLMNIIAGSIKPDSGMVLLDDEDVLLANLVSLLTCKDAHHLAHVVDKH